MCIILLRYLGRKKTLIMSNVLSGVSMLAIAFVDKNDEHVIVTLATLGLVGM